MNSFLCLKMKHEKIEDKKNTDVNESDPFRI